MSKESESFDDEVAGIVQKLEELPLFRRRDKAAASLAMLILGARFAMEEQGTKNDFVESANDAWELEAAR